MKIGTPDTASATKALLLGSGELGKEIAISLQRYGVEVIAVDRYAGAPAMQVAHRRHVIDMTDAAAVKALIALERPHFIVPELEAIATDALAEIERAGQTAVVPNARAIQLTMNREAFASWRPRSWLAHLALRLRRKFRPITGRRERRHRLPLLRQAHHVFVR